MNNRKITELPVYVVGEDITAMAIADRSKVIYRVNLSEFDCTSEEDAEKRVKDSLEKHGHVLIIPYKPL